jgi:hypothetical protein
MERNEEVEAIREQRTAYGWSRPSPGELASDHARRTDRSRSVRWWSRGSRDRSRAGPDGYPQGANPRHGKTPAGDNIGGVVPP